MVSIYNIILAEDHVRFRGEIKKIIDEIPGVEVVAEVGEGRKLFELLETSRPDLVLLDMAMPNLRAMKGTQDIKSLYPEVKVIIMAMDGEAAYLSHALSAGADGMLLKQDCARDLGLAIQKVRRGERYFSGYLKEVRFRDDTVNLGSFGLLNFLT